LGSSLQPCLLYCATLCLSFGTIRTRKTIRQATRNTPTKTPQQQEKQESEKEETQDLVTDEAPEELIDGVDAAEEDVLSNQLTDNNEHQEVNENVLDKAQVTAQGNVKGASVYIDKQSQSVYPVNVAHDNGQNELSMTLNTATNNYNQYGGAVPPQTASFEADDSYSAIQASKATSKAGWCFIGEDRGFRSCIEVGDNDKCMSGDIFPTMDICVNPSLRQ
jgi:hypothetical protein